MIIAAQLSPITPDPSDLILAASLSAAARLGYSNTVMVPLFTETSCPGTDAQGSASGTTSPGFTVARCSRRATTSASVEVVASGGSVGLGQVRSDAQEAVRSATTIVARAVRCERMIHSSKGREFSELSFYASRTTQNQLDGQSFPIASVLVLLRSDFMHFGARSVHFAT